MKTDTLFYRLFQNHPDLALELLGLDYSASSYRFGSEEIKQMAFRLDGIFTPLVDDPAQPLIFAEVQYQPDDDFYDRLFTEICLYLRLNKPQHDWLALVIYPTRAVERPANIAFLPFMDLPQLHIVYLEDYQQQAGVSLSLDLVRLLNSQTKQTLEVAHDIVNRYDDISADVLNFIETILVYKIPRLGREEIRKMLDLSEVELKETRFYQEVWGEGIDEGKHIMLQRMLTLRFGELPIGVQQSLEQANAQQIEQWGDRFVNASSLDAVFKESIN